MNKTIHIVCLDAPSPPDYGGAIDMYYKIKALAMQGHRIILHYFDYRENRGVGALKDVCTEVHSYARKSFIASFSLSKPYIVSSRISRQLVARLNQDNHPVILEGLHCTGILPYLENPSRVLVRMHNEEESYYRSLYNSAASFIRRNYFLAESRLIRKYQNDLLRTIKIACLSETDIEKFSAQGFRDIHFIPCFIPWRHNTSLTGKGDYCLYHGNMAIEENEKAATWLIENVFRFINLPLVIAGNKISQGLQQKAKAFPHVQLVNDPSIEKLESLIKDAHINVLPSMNTTGVKLKLLHALFAGRFCITNQEGIRGSGISAGVHIGDKPEAFRQIILELQNQSFSHSDIEVRREIARVYNNQENAGRLSELL